MFVCLLLIFVVENIKTKQDNVNGGIEQIKTCGMGQACSTCRKIRNSTSLVYPWTQRVFAEPIKSNIII